MRREYEEALEKVGVRVLDVYRFKDKDIIRFLYKGKVYVVDLKRYYDSMKPDDLVNAVLSHTA
jgi:SepF-like predicted cell division protein (DUF552 family)